MILCLFCHCSRQLHTCLLAPFSSLALTHFCSIFVVFFTPSLFFSLLTRTWLDLTQFFLKAKLCSKKIFNDTWKPPNFSWRWSYVQKILLTTPQKLPIFLERRSYVQKNFLTTPQNPPFFCPSGLNAEALPKFQLAGQKSVKSTKC